MNIVKEESEFQVNSQRIYLYWSYELTILQKVSVFVWELQLEIVLNYFYWHPDESSEQYTCFDITNYAFSFENEYVWNNIHNRIILTIFVICIHRRSAMGWWWASGLRHSITWYRMSGCDGLTDDQGNFIHQGLLFLFPMRWYGLAGGNRHFSVQGRRKV